MVVIQDLLQIFLDYDNYGDFQDGENWGTFFELFSAKVDQINEQLSKAVTERDMFMQECQTMEARHQDYTTDADEE